ncbi:hypothetical protein PspLS_04454, partial [Pyricularia sp. CBS 133598]
AEAGWLCVLTAAVNTAQPNISKASLGVIYFHPCSPLRCPCTRQTLPATELKPAHISPFCSLFFVLPPVGLKDISEY